MKASKLKEESEEMEVEVETERPTAGLSDKMKETLRNNGCGEE